MPDSSCACCHCKMKPGSTKRRSTASYNRFGESYPPLVAVIIKLVFLCIFSSHTCSAIKCSRLLRMNSKLKQFCSLTCNWDKPFVTVTHSAMQWLTQIILLSLTLAPTLSKTSGLEPLSSEKRVRNKTGNLWAHRNWLSPAMIALLYSSSWAGCGGFYLIGRISEAVHSFKYTTTWELKQEKALQWLKSLIVLTKKLIRFQRVWGFFKICEPLGKKSEIGLPLAPVIIYEGWEIELYSVFLPFERLGFNYMLQIS